MASDPAQCFLDHRARVYRWAHAMCGRHDDALDVVQEVFLRLMRKPPTLPNTATTAAWLRRVTARVVIDQWRAQKARNATERAYTPRIGPQPTVESRELAELIQAGLTELSEQQRLVLMAKCYDQMTFRQIADELDIAVPTAKTHYLRGLSALRERLRADLKTGSMT